MRLDPSNLSFDRFGRLRRIAEIIESLDASKILDIGGFPCLLADALPDREVWTADRQPCERERYVEASGDNLPMGDDEFDVVVASDVLEHVPAESRGAFLDECLRVAKSHVIFSGPFDTPGVAYCESTVHDWRKRLSGQGDEWLAEHIACGLPSLETTAKHLSNAGASINVTGNGDLTQWLMMMFADAAISALPGAHQAAGALSQAANKHWQEDTPNAATYRHIIVAELDGKIDESEMPVSSPDVEARLRALAAGLEIVVDALARQRSDATGDEQLLTEYVKTLEAALADNRRGASSQCWLSRLRGFLGGEK